MTFSFEPDNRWDGPERSSGRGREFYNFKWTGEINGVPLEIRGHYRKYLDKPSRNEFIDSLSPTWIVVRGEPASLSSKEDGPGKTGDMLKEMFLRYVTDKDVPDFATEESRANRAKNEQREKDLRVLGLTRE